MSGDEQLDQLFASYRAACPEIEPGPNFMPELWARIEARRGFWPSFKHLGRIVMAVCAFACMLLALMDYRTSAAPDQSYAEALETDQNAALAYHADIVRTADYGADALR